METLSRSKHSRGEVRLIRRIGIVLRLKAEGCAARISVAVLAAGFAGQEVAAVELQARFCRPDLHHAPACWLIDFGCASERASAPVEHEVVIVAVAEAQLPILFVDVRADLCWAREVVGRA